MNSLKIYIAGLTFLLSLSAKADLAPKKILVFNFTAINYDFDLFQTQTGIPVEVDHNDAALLWTKLNDPENPSRPDLLLFDDLTDLTQSAKKGWFAPIPSPTVAKNIPAQFRDLQAGWVGLSFRARTMVYNPKLVSPTELSTYEDLANPQWKGRLCLRKGTYKYTQALVASLLLNEGPEQTSQVLQGWVRNNTQPIYLGDQPLVQALENGSCGVALVNTQYLASYKSKNPNSQLQIFWANQNSRGAHVNITGAGLFYQAPHPDLALRLLEFISGDAKAAAHFADAKFEYPTHLQFKSTAPLVMQFGEFKFDSRSLSQIGGTEPQALDLTIRSGYSP